MKKNNKEVPYFIHFMIDKRFAKEEVSKTSREGKYVLNHLHQYLMDDIRRFNCRLTDHELRLAAWSIIIDSSALQKLRKISGEKLWLKIYSLYLKHDKPTNEMKYYRRFERTKKEAKTKLLTSLGQKRRMARTNASMVNQHAVNSKTKVI